MFKQAGLHRERPCERVSAVCIHLAGIWKFCDETSSLLLLQSEERAVIRGNLLKLGKRGTSRQCLGGS